MKRYLVPTLVAVTSIVVAAAAGGTKTYTDASGDSGTAPDLSNVEVSESGGFIVFKISGTLVPSSSIELYIDADRNRSTGDDGDELWISLYQEADGKSYWDADRWNGSKWDDDAHLDVVSQTFTGREEIGFKTEEAGLDGPFDFVVLSFKTVADAVESRDRAPDSIVPWTYELASRWTVTPLLGQLRLAPARVTAGKAVTVSAPVRRSDTNGALVGGTARCTLRVGTRSATARGVATGGRATCRLVVPKGSSGKTARGSIVVDYRGESATKSFSLRIT
jgi:hypothetical protein